MPIVGLLANNVTKQYMHFNMETSKYLQSCTVPVQMIHGQADTFILPSNSASIKKENPNVGLQFVPNVDHNGIIDYWSYTTTANVLNLFQTFNK